jgi:hypothetical protein
MPAGSACGIVFLPPVFLPEAMPHLSVREFVELHFEIRNFRRRMPKYN